MKFKTVVITKKTEMGKSKTETEPTESSRLMRGAWKVDYEYILELHTERAEAQVSCDGVADVIPATVMLVTD